MEMGRRSVCEQFRLKVFIVTVYFDAFTVAYNRVVVFSFSVFTVTFIVENLCNHFIYDFEKIINMMKMQFLVLMLLFLIICFLADILCRTCLCFFMLKCFEIRD